MESIETMIADVLKREGGYVNHPFDRGGPTKYGVTQRTLSRYIGRQASREEVKSLDVSVAKEIFLQNYYLKPSIHRLPPEIQPFIFDAAINHGPRRAIKFVQSVCNQAAVSRVIKEDGAIGPNTLSAVKDTLNAMQGHFLEALIEERRNFYHIIVAANPSQKVFLKGWENRLAEFESKVRRLRNA
ncbi:glycoside hydrolase family 108 protein [Thaumasiovibrio subtropicus]|uniref:glycoside hydrolase family 108 protein n=1 Tax=Thaumasiovibrio subtropicus TaxID=1891207 RepID=UPI000B35D3F9|nr:N-acetylmuramidase [Thaumasiovibrio subtropicus]